MTEEQKLEKEITEYYETKSGRLSKPRDWDLIRKGIQEEKFTRDEMIQGINLAFLQARSINSFEYCLKVMRTEREKREKAAKKRVVPFKRSEKPDKPLPQAIRMQMEQQNQPQQPPTEGGG